MLHNKDLFYRDNFKFNFLSIFEEFFFKHDFMYFQITKRL